MVILWLFSIQVCIDLRRYKVADSIDCIVECSPQVGVHVPDTAGGVIHGFKDIADARVVQLHVLSMDQGGRNSQTADMQTPAGKGDCFGNQVDDFIDIVLVARIILDQAFVRDVFPDHGMSQVVVLEMIDLLIDWAGHVRISVDSRLAERLLLLQCLLSLF